MADIVTGLTALKTAFDLAKDIKMLQAHITMLK